MADTASAEFGRRLEAAAIGALILNPSALDLVRRWLVPGDFAVPHYRAWYTSICQMRHAGVPVDQLTLLAQLRRAGGNQLDRHHLVELATIAERVPIPAAAVSYCTTVLEESLRRELWAAGTRLVQISRGGDPAVMFANARQVHADVDAGRRRWLDAHPRSGDDRADLPAPSEPARSRPVAEIAAVTAHDDLARDL